MTFLGEGFLQEAIKIVIKEIMFVQCFHCIYAVLLFLVLLRTTLQLQFIVIKIKKGLLLENTKKKSGRIYKGIVVKVFKFLEKTDVT